MSKPASLRLTAAALCLFGASAQANLLSNGSFEDGAFVPVPLTNTMSLDVGDTTMTGWTVVDKKIAWILQPAFGLNASDGQKFLDLTDYSNLVPFGGVTQAIATVVGQAYTLSFDLGSSAAYNIPSSVVAIIDANPGVTFVSTSINNNVWQSFSLNFTAASVLTSITLTGGSGTPGTFYVGLDNIDVSAVSPVPEPEALVLALAGIGIVAASRRRRT